MKILFTADLHIKIGQKNVPKDWQRNRYLKLFNSINDICHSRNIDLLVLGGDIFDKVPSLDELELYFNFINSINTRTILYPGNHEMLSKKKSFYYSLKDITENLNSNISIIEKSMSIDNMDFIPYNEIKTFNPKNYSGDILFTHVRGEIKPHVKPEIDLNKLNRWKIVLAGDLHSYSNSQRNILYPGSPLSTSFHRSPIENGIIIFDNITLEHEWVKLDLPQLLRITVKDESEIKKTDYHHTIYELEGDIHSLSNVDKNELLDKKIIYKNNEAKIDFKKMKTIPEELKIYLKDVLKIEDKNISYILEILHDYIDEDDLV